MLVEVRKGLCKLEDNLVLQYSESLQIVALWLNCVDLRLGIKRCVPLASAGRAINMLRRASPNRNWSWRADRLSSDRRSENWSEVGREREGRVVSAAHWPCADEWRRCRYHACADKLVSKQNRFQGWARNYRISPQVCVLSGRAVCRNLIKSRYQSLGLLQVRGRIAKGYFGFGFASQPVSIPILLTAEYGHGHYAICRSRSPNDNAVFMHVRCVRD